MLFTAALISMTRFLPCRKRTMFLSDYLLQFGLPNYNKYKTAWMDENTIFITGERRLSVVAQGIVKMPDSHRIRRKHGRRLVAAIFSTRLMREVSARSILVDALERFSVVGELPDNQNNIVSHPLPAGHSLTTAAFETLLPDRYPCIAVFNFYLKLLNKESFLVFPVE